MTYYNSQIKYVPISSLSRARLTWEVHTAKGQRNVDGRMLIPKVRKPTPPHYLSPPLIEQPAEKLNGHSFNDVHYRRTIGRCLIWLATILSSCRYFRTDAYARTLLFTHDRYSCKSGLERGYMAETRGPPCNNRTVLPICTGVTACGTAKRNHFEFQFSPQVKVTDVKRSFYSVVLNLAQGTVSQSFVDIT